MQSFFGRLGYFVRTIMFWGILYMIILLSGFKISIAAILHEALNGALYINCFCIYMIISIPVYLVLLVIHLKLSGLPLGDTLVMDMDEYFSMPFFNFKIEALLHERRTKIQKEIFHFDLIQTIYGVSFTVCWWIVFLFGLYNVLMVDNEIKNSILAFSQREIFIRVVIILFALMVLKAVTSIAMKYTFKKWEKEDREERHNKNKKSYTNYYDKHPGKIPVGCRACGGPYPDCKTSCNVYDD